MKPLTFGLYLCLPLSQVWAWELAQSEEGRESLEWAETQRWRRPRESMEPGTGLDALRGPSPREALWSMNSPRTGLAAEECLCNLLRSFRGFGSWSGEIAQSPHQRGPPGMLLTL